MADGAQGVVLPDPFDVGAVAAAVRRCLAERAAMSAAAAALRPALGRDRHVRELVALYAQLTGNRREQPALST